MTEYFTNLIIFIIYSTKKRCMRWHLMGAARPGASRREEQKEDLAQERTLKPSSVTS